MARHTPDSTTKPPADRPGGTMYFYASEVVRILDLQGIDYAQLRRLLRLARPRGAQPGRQWARFTFEDLVAIRVAVGLGGGAEALAQGRRLQLAELERACARLRELGIKNPLVEIPLRREGRSITAEIDGVTFRPSTGQLALRDTHARVQSYLARVVELDRPRATALRSEMQQYVRDLTTETQIPRIATRRGLRIST